MPKSGTHHVARARAPYSAGQSIAKGRGKNSRANRKKALDDAKAILAMQRKMGTVKPLSG